MNKFAISSGGLGEALERSASSLRAANNTIHESASLITAANEVVQNPEKVGTAMKTISMRIRSAKTEMEEMGEDTTGMVESTAQLRAEIKALSGVDIMASATEFKSTYAIMDELSQKWKDLTDIQQASIIELMAGKHQGNVFASLMQNFQTARDALDVSLNSSGSAMAEHAKWSNSLEARLNKLKAAWQSLSQTFMKSDFLKFVLDGIMSLVDGVTKLIDTFGTLPTLLTAFAAFKSFSGKGFFKVVKDEATGVAKGMTTVFRGAATEITKSLSSIRYNSGSKFSAQLSNDVHSLFKYRDAVKNGTSSTHAFEKYMTNASAAAKQYADATDASSISVTAFKKQQQQAQVSTLAQNKSLSSSLSLFREYRSGCKATGMSQTDFLNAVKNTNPQLAKQMASSKGAAGAMFGYITSLAGAKIATFALQAATMALNAALTMGISLIVSSLFSAISNWINREERLAEKVDEVTSKFKEQHEELQKLKGDYDTSNETSMISKYEKLSKGVNRLGENVSLTADEYSEYQSIVNSIADQIPSLVSGYDSQGNAILSVKGNVEELTKAYEKLIHTQNNEILGNTGNIEKDFDNVLDDLEGIESIPAEELNSILFDNSLSSKEKLQKIINLDGFNTYLGSQQSLWVGKLLKKRGVNVGTNVMGMPTGQGVAEALVKTAEDAPEKIRGIFDNVYDAYEAEAEGMRSLAQAALSEAFDISDSEYYEMSDTMQALARQIVGSFDFEFFKGLREDGTSVTTYINDMLDQLMSISKDDAASIEAAFDLQTRFNGGEISYGEYVKGLEDAGNLINSLNIDQELKTQLKLNLGLNEDGLVEEYQNLKNRLADDKQFNIMPSEYESFLNSLSSEELSILIDIIPELSDTEYRETVDDLKNAIKNEMMLQGLTFDLNLEAESAGIEALNAALAESVSATGLSSESIAALRSRYADLEAQGYDLSVMFEETSHGVRLNRQEFNKLEKAYATQKLEEVDADLNEMKVAYDDLGEAIKNCDDPIRKSELFNEKQMLAKRISEAATLAAQYEGLTSAYNNWLAAEEAGQERDMYEKVISGFGTVDDEISRGWVDDGSIAFLELLTGRTDLAGKSGAELKKIYDGLGESIKYIGKNGEILEDTGYSVRDFFTVDEDGNSTNAGVYNFLDAIGRLEEEAFNGEDIVKRDDNDNIIGFDFELAGGDEAIAEALGVSEELVQIMVRAADDAGFVVSMDGTYRQLADMQNEARAAVNYLNELFDEEYSFDFNTTSIDSLKEQLEEANELLYKEDENGNKLFWNKDGTFNFDADGATEAMQIVSTLQAKLDNLTAEQYGIGLTVEDEELREPLENLQTYGQKVAALNQLKLNPKANAEEILELEAELDEIANKFIELPDEKKIEIGLVGENGEAFTEDYFNSLTDEKKMEIGLVGEDGKPIDDYTDAVQKKIESGEIKIPTILDIQTNMDKNLETLADLALLNSGLLSEEEEEVIRKKYKVEPEVEVDDTTDWSESWFSGFAPESFVAEAERQGNIKIIAETVGIENVDDLSSKLEGLDDTTVKAIAEVLGQIDVDKLKDTMAKLKPTEVEAIAKAIGEGDVDSLKTAISNLNPTYVQAIAEAFGYSDVQDLYNVIDNLDPKTVEAVANALGITDVESLKGAIDNVKGKDVEVNATTSGEDKLFGLRSIIDGIKSKTVTITSWFKKIVSGGSTRNDSNGFSDVNGTAHADGTTGKAFKQGNWRTKKSETALTGELGREIVVTPENRWYTVGDNGAEFVNIPRGSIVFNHKQTEELLKNGKATSDDGRAKALVSGTAFAGGSSGFGGIGKFVSEVVSNVKNTAKKAGTKIIGTAKNTIKEANTLISGSGGSDGNGGVGKTDGSSSVDGSGGSGGGSSSKEEFKETLDWIEVAISRIERAIDNLDQKANNIYKTWSERNKALISEIGKVRDEIELQQAGYERYIQEANSVGLSSDWAEKVRNGEIDIETIKDEDLAEKIKEYQQWYEKALDCQDAIEELKETEASLYAQRLENVSAQYEGILGVIEHEKNMLEEYISQSEANAQLISGEYYKALSDNERDTLAQLEKEKAAMLAELQAAMESGTIAVGSEAWYQMVASIDEVTLAIAESQTQLLEYEQILQQLSWETFDLLQEKISAVTEEADFLIELLSNDKLYDDNGQLTNEGMSTMGLHGQNYNAYMYQADQAAAEAEKLRQQLEQDPYDTELEERYREMIALQQEMILAAQDEKEAIKDLVEEGIELELDALQERIDKYNEAIESQKDLYDYQKRVQEQSEEIASLEKQRASYLGDTSEEAKAKLQEIEVSLKEAREELQETEYDRYISDQQQLLDNLYLEYEEILNMRLDNIDALLADMIAEINMDASVIGDTIRETADSVGYTLSDSMQTIWDASATDINGVITIYGEKFSSAQTTTNNALNAINTNLQKMISQLNSIAKTNVESASASSAANSSEANVTEKPKEESKPDNKPQEPTIKVGGKINAGGAPIYDYAGDTSGERQLYRNDPIYTVLSEKNGYLLTRWHKLSSGYTGWFKKSDVKAYASGTKKIAADDMAWTQEKGREYIVRPSDGAILTPVAKGDSVLTSAASGNIWSMANNPTEFIRDNLKLDAANVPSGANVQNSCIQNFENITFSMPNVRNYEQLVSEMQRDPKFEKLILAMTVDQIAGKSKLAKNKAIR